MRIYYAGNEDQAAMWRQTAFNYLVYLEKMLGINSRGYFLFSPVDNVEIIISYFENESRIDILYQEEEKEIADMKNVIAVGRSFKDFKMFLVDDESKHRRYELDFRMPAQVVGDKIVNDKSVTVVAPRVSEAEMRQAIDSDIISEARIEFGKKVAFYNKVINNFLHKAGMMLEGEQILAVGRLGE